MIVLWHPDTNKQLPGFLKLMDYLNSRGLIGLVTMTLIKHLSVPVQGQHLQRFEYIVAGTRFDAGSIQIINAQ